MSNSFAFIACSPLALVVLLATGCSPPAATDYATQPEARLVGEKAPPKKAAEFIAAETPVEVIQEIWEETYLQGVKVGFSKTEIAKVREGDATLVRCRQTGELRLKRDGQSSDQTMIFTCWQTTDGKLVRFESKMEGAGSKTLGSGKVEGSKLRTKTLTVGKEERQTFDWQPEYGGYVAMDESLRKQPLKPKEKRTIVALTAPINIPAVTQLTAEDYELTKLLTGEQKLLKVQAAIALGNQTLDTTLWVTEQGEILKTRQPLGLETYRATKSAATNMANIGEVDLLRSTVVKPKVASNPQRKRGTPAEIAADLSSAHRTIYIARLKEGNPAKSFSSDLSQQLESIDPQSARLTITAIRPDVPQKLTAKIPGPAPHDLLPTTYIQSDDAEIIKLAGSVAAQEKDAWKIACAFEKFVDATITDKNFGSALATAAEVARTKAGDCTEHSVLFAALCRARKIPARVAFGLIYSEHLGGFAYHMWTEVWIKDRWIPMDATLGQGGIGCDHIKLGDSNLKGSESLAAMASVAQVLNQLELEIVEID
ncbi:MAG: transglutaminase family protein [Planctomycetales bacterium]|nr:transglutaminase family protein [Planctomycetales bacterium]